MYVRLSGNLSFYLIKFKISSLLNLYFLLQHWHVSSVSSSSANSIMSFLPMLINAFSILSLEQSHLYLGCNSSTSCVARSSDMYFAISFYFMPSSSICVIDFDSFKRCSIRLIISSGVSGIICNTYPPAFFTLPSFSTSTPRATADAVCSDIA